VLEHLVERRDLFAGELRVFPTAGVERAQFGEREVGELRIAAGVVSCMIASWPSLVRRTSNSAASAPCFHASSCETTVFSGAS
jgi:hypothetical protein